VRYLVWVTLKGIFRDRVFQGILLAAVLFCVIPTVSSMSMRQVVQLATTLSLSLVSFILLLLAVFLGGTSLWKDLERRYVFSVLGLPISRGQYLVGKYFGTAVFVLLMVVILGVVSCGVIAFSAGAYPPDRPIVWSYIWLALLFDALKYLLLIALAFLFSSVSTSFFLPIFGTISIFWVGSFTQEAFEYVQSAAGQQMLPSVVRTIASGLYYVLPNFGAFDLKTFAIYSVAPDFSGLALTVGYFFVYLALVLWFAVIIFSKRELK